MLQKPQFTMTFISKPPHSRNRCHSEWPFYEKA